MHARGLQHARFAPILIASVFVIAQLGSFVHELRAHHGRCPDDGDLVDLPEASPPPTARAASSTTPSASDAARDQLANHADHCALSAIAHGPAPAATFATAMLDAPALPAPDARSPDAPPDARAIYLTAPKTSPPV